MIQVLLLLSLIGLSLHPLRQHAPRSEPPLIEDIELRGNRRIPRETALKPIGSKPGGRYDETQARKDLEAILALGFFDPLYTRLFTDRGPRDGVIMIFVVREYPVIRALRFEGLESVSEADILARLRERKIDLDAGSLFNPEQIKTATSAILELLAEKDQPDAKVDIEIQDISATTIIVTFRISE